MQDPGPATSSQQSTHYRFNGRMRELVEGYNAIVQILFPRYAWYVFPGYLQWALFQRYVKHFKGKYRVVPIPNRLHDLLIAKEFLQSEHIVFAHPDVYEKFVSAPDVNFVKLLLTTASVEENNTNPKDDDVPEAINVQLLPKSHCDRNCLYVKVAIEAKCSVEFVYKLIIYPSFEI